MSQTSPASPVLPELIPSLLKIPVSDISRSVAFYRDVLGFDEQFVVAEFGWAQLSVGSTGSTGSAASSIPFALYVPGKGGGDRTMGGSVDFHWSTPDLDGLFGRWSGARSEAQEFFLSEIMVSADGSRFLEVTDPDSNVLTVMEVQRDA